MSFSPNGFLLLCRRAAGYVEQRAKAIARLARNAAMRVGTGPFRCAELCRDEPCGEAMGLPGAWSARRARERNAKRAEIRCCLPSVSV